MVYKFTAVKSITDPHERARRLAQLYRHFEQNTAAESDSVSEAGKGSAAAERQASTHVAGPGNSTPRLARRQRAGVR